MTANPSGSVPLATQCVDTLRLPAQPHDEFLEQTIHHPSPSVTGDEPGLTRLPRLDRARRWLARSCPESGSGVVADPGVFGGTHHGVERRATHVDQLLVVARLEPDVALADQGVVDDGLDPVGAAAGRDRAEVAVAEQRADLGLAREFDATLERAADKVQVEPMRGGSPRPARRSRKRPGSPGRRAATRSSPAGRPARG